MEQVTPGGMTWVLTGRLQTQLLMAACSILEGGGVVCVADSPLIKLDCPSGVAVTRAKVSVGRYVYQVMLHNIEPVMSVCLSS